MHINADISNHMCVSGAFGCMQTDAGIDVLSAIEQEPPSTNLGVLDNWIKVAREVVTWSVCN
jgi:hypothetical protein